MLDDEVITDAFHQSIRKMHSIRTSISSILCDVDIQASDLCIVYFGQEEKLGKTCSLPQAKAVVLIGDESWSFFSEKIAEIGANLRHLYLAQMNFSPELSTDFIRQSALLHLTLKNCYFKQISDSLAYLTTLNRFEILNCRQLQGLPENFNSLQALEYIKIQGCDLNVSSSQFIGFTRLQSLSLIDCPKIADIQVREAYAQSCQVVVEYCSQCIIQIQPVRDAIKTQVSYQQHGDYQDVLMLMPFLLSNCRHTQIHLHLEINAWRKKVKRIDPILFELSSLQQLRLVDFHDLSTLSNQIEKFANLSVFEIIKSDKLQQLPDRIGQLQQLKKLRLIRLKSIEALPVEIGHLTQLEILDVSGCRQLRTLPESIGQLKKLKILRLAGCNDFEYLPKAVGTLTELECLHLSGCVKLQNLPDLSGLKHLKILHLSGCSFQTLPDSLKDLVSLEVLHLSGCHLLEELPLNLDQLTKLTTIYLTGCIAIKNRALFYKKYPKIRLIVQQKF